MHFPSTKIELESQFKSHDFISSFLIEGKKFCLHSLHKFDFVFPKQIAQLTIEHFTHFLSFESTGRKYPLSHFISLFISFFLSFFETTIIMIIKIINNMRILNIKLFFYAFFWKLFLHLHFD